jgi:hypothetical protein
MTTKLTLTVDKAVIVRAKSYARKTGRSLSEIVENYLEQITADIDKDNLSEKLSRIVGTAKLPLDFNEDKELREYYEKKHL